MMVATVVVMLTMAAAAVMVVGQVLEMRMHYELPKSPQIEQIQNWNRAVDQNRKLIPIPILIHHHAPHHHPHPPPKFKQPT